MLERHSRPSALWCLREHQADELWRELTVTSTILMPFEALRATKSLTLRRCSSSDGGAGCVSKKCWLELQSMLRLVARRQPPQDHGAVAGTALSGRASARCSHLLLAGLDPLALPARYAARGASAGSHASLSPAPYASWLGSVGRKADVLQSSHDVSSLSDSAGPSVVRNALAAGWGHSLLAYSGAQDTQRAFALGRNEAAQLGIGFASHEPTRGVVEGFKGDEILQAAASCQCSYLLLGNGEDSTRLFAAGSRQRGRLGQIGGERAAHLDEDDASRQVALIASMSPITTPEHSGPIVEVATGFDHLLVRTCKLLVVAAPAAMVLTCPVASGRLLGSGANSDGQLGLGGASVRDVETLTDVSPFGAHDDTVVTVRSGADTSFAIMRSGELWAWGNSVSLAQYWSGRALKLTSTVTTGWQEYAQACHGSIIDQVLEPQLVETRGWLPSGRQIVDVRCGGSFTVILDGESPRSARECWQGMNVPVPGPAEPELTRAPIFSSQKPRTRVHERQAGLIGVAAQAPLPELFALRRGPG